MTPGGERLAEAGSNKTIINMSRPEAATGGRADKFYCSSEAASYSQSNRLRRVQLSLGKRSLELLQLTTNSCHLLTD